MHLSVKDKWWRIVLLNVMAAAVLLVIFRFALEFNTAYNWAWNSYIKHNLNEIRPLRHAPLDQRLGMKLGEDYHYLAYIRDHTPEDAVIYYPSLSDFKDPMEGENESPFTGKLTDKLSALRVLYPRRLVMSNEWGASPWTEKVTHVAIVNGKNLDKLRYAPPQGLFIGILPIDSVAPSAPTTTSVTAP